MVLDQLDKNIIQCLSIGVSSYQDLARQCNVARNTIYRRIETLEKQGVIRNTLSCIVNLEQLGVVPITVGITVPQRNQDKAVELLLNEPSVRWLCRTFGDHNLATVAFSSKGEEGATIQRIQSMLETLGSQRIDVSVGFIWEKMSLQPFNKVVNLETQFKALEPCHIIT